MIFKFFLFLVAVIFSSEVTYTSQEMFLKEKEEIYQKFLQVKLTYRPQEGSDVGRVDMPISALTNPLEGTFDLSRCGDAAKYLSISTGYRKEKKDENENKLEIWITPRFLVEKALDTTEMHVQLTMFQCIMWPSTAPVGIFWNGGWAKKEECHYLTSETLDMLSSGNLYEKLKRSSGLVDGVACRRCFFEEFMKSDIYQISHYTFEMK